MSSLSQVEAQLEQIEVHQQKHQTALSRIRDLQVLGVITQEDVPHLTAIAGRIILGSMALDSQANALRHDIMRQKENLEGTTKGKGDEDDTNKGD